jgi:hypothetical protein
MYKNKGKGKVIGKKRERIYQNLNELGQCQKTGRKKAE